MAHIKYILVLERVLIMRIKTGRLYTDGERRDGGILKIEDGRFAGFDAAGDFDIDLSQYIVFPGFVDMHTHGGMGFDCTTASFDELDDLSMFYAQNGVATFCATTVTSAPDVVLNAVRTIARRCEKGTKGANIAGAYLEGPYINEKFRGAHDETLLRAISLDEIEEIIDASGGWLRVFALAPELPGAEDAIRYITSRGVRVSCGHSAASCEEANAGFDAGATIAIHTYNAMKGLHHRDVGLLGASLTRNDVYNEIICDMIHVSKEAAKIAVACKSEDKIVFITDSMCATGMADGSYKLGELPVTVKDGIVRTMDGALAGSSLRTNVALGNVVTKLGVPIEKAMLGVTKNPASALGLDGEIGSISEGKRAHLAVLDEKFNAVMTMVDGKVVFKA